MSPSEETLARIKAQLEATGEAPTAFGRRVTGDPHLVRQMGKGRQPRWDLMQRIIAALEDPSAIRPPKHPAQPQVAA